MSFSNQAVITFSEEQAELLEVARRFCEEKSPIATVRALLEDERGHDPAVWQEMAGLGWLGIAVPEAHGGVGLSMAEVVPVVEQMGRRLMAGPFVSTTLAAQAILHGGDEAQKGQWLPELVAGTPAALALSEPHGDWDLTRLEATATREGDALVLAGRKVLVSDAHVAGWLLTSVQIEGAPALVMVPRSAVPDEALRREVVIDETRRSFQVTLDGIRVPAENLLRGDTRHALARLQLGANLLLAAEMSGGTASCIDYTVEYLNTRKQFGRLIGSYQALKHPIVDAHVGYEHARSLLYSAASMFGDQGEAEVAVRMAKAQAGKVMGFAADRAIQFHGGFGFTYDCDAQLYRRRAIWCDSQHGDAGYQRQRLAALMLPAG